MTGRYEEPETRELGPTGNGSTGNGAGGAARAEDGPAPESSAEADGSRAHGEPDYGTGVSYVEPQTNPASMSPAQVPPGVGDSPQSGPQPVQPPYPGQAPDAVQPPQPGDPQGPPSAPTPQQSGPVPVDPGQVDPNQSGPSQQPATSGPYPVDSGPYPAYGTSGSYAVPADPSAPYYQAPPPYGAPAQPGQMPQPGQPGQPGQPVQPGQPGQPGQVPQAGQPGQSNQQPFPQPQQVSGPSGTPDQPFGQDLSSAQLLRQTKRPPQSGWRRAIYVASGRTINLGESRADVRRRELIERINQPLHGCYKIAMLSLKGGVGKTTTTATLGSTFASLRGDRVIAVDANPDRGTLSQKIPLETTATVRHLLRDAQAIRKYSDVRSYTSQGPSRLEILASEQDPAVSEAFSEVDYRRSVTLLEHFYNVVLTDCGTGLMHSAMKGVLDVADSLVLVSSSSIDGARSASATLDWLDAHGYGELVSRSVAVINSVRPGSGKVDVDKLAAHFDSRCRAVSKVPFDPHLEEGAEVELDHLAAPTRLALLELAAIVADDFPHALGRQRHGDL